VNRNGYVHFCPGASFSRYTELRPDALGSVPHSAESPEPIAGVLTRLGTYPAAVVANYDPKESAQVLHLDLDLRCLGMTQRVHDRFSPDQKELLVGCRIHCSRFSLNENPKSYTATGPCLFQEVVKSLFETRSRS
jgi:hypothetical protein